MSWLLGYPLHTLPPLCIALFCYCYTPLLLFHTFTTRFLFLHTVLFTHALVCITTFTHVCVPFTTGSLRSLVQVLTFVPHTHTLPFLWPFCFALYSLPHPLQLPLPSIPFCTMYIHLWFCCTFYYIYILYVPLYILPLYIYLLLLLYHFTFTTFIVRLLYVPHLHPFVTFPFTFTTIYYVILPFYIQLVPFAFFAPLRSPTPPHHTHTLHTYI